MEEHSFRYMVFVEAGVSGIEALVVRAQHQPPEGVLPLHPLLPSLPPRGACTLTHADVHGGARSAGA
ncbi:unnamed protein product [Taenia asiatica]|uniref:Uncharacterized protein n=1 Tax=Taenia asiatica TaxID=60517 RepID=A0A3P6P3Y6_TAEAS|nr:unnamed protein product [Taenia asiatica]